MKKSQKIALAFGLTVATLGGGLALAHGGRGGRMAEQFDTNKDGQLDDKERAAMKQAHQQKRAEMLAKYDANKDGQLDDAERGKLHDDMMAQRFAELDSNKDGQISLAEFKAGHQAMGGHGHMKMGRDHKGH